MYTLVYEYDPLVKMGVVYMIHSRKKQATDSIPLSLTQAQRPAGALQCHRAASSPGGKHGTRTTGRKPALATAHTDEQQQP